MASLEPGVQSCHAFSVEGLARVVSPVVIPAGEVEGVADLLADPGPDLADLVEALRAVTTVELREAPAAAMRVSGSEDLRVLEALSRPS